MPIIKKDYFETVFEGEIKKASNISLGSSKFNGSTMAIFRYRKLDGDNPTYTLLGSDITIRVGDRVIATKIDKVELLVRAFRNGAEIDSMRYDNII